MSEYENGGDGLEEALGKELENLDSQLERIDREVGEIAVRLDHLREEREVFERRKVHARALLGGTDVDLYGESSAPGTSAMMMPADIASYGASEDISEPLSSPRPYPTENIGDQIANAVFDVLKNQESLELDERSMHYREIVQKLQQRNIYVAGRDPGLNMIAHIHKDTRFRRPKRGHYALSKWYEDSPRNVGEHKKGRRGTR